MHWVDWLIMTLPLVICGWIAIHSRRYVRGVAEFVAGGRGAGRFLICAARSQQGSGAAVFVAMFQVFLISGFTLGWWGQISTPVTLLVMISGFVIYRYRQTRAMTLGQFFEMRYSRKFRLFAGGLGFFAGIFNFGIIPAIGARFMVAFLNLPQQIDIMHVCLFLISVPTYVLLMGFFLTICVIMTTTAGQVSVLLTDCAEGMFSQLFYTLIAIALLIWVFDWNQTKHFLLDAQPGKSLVNPFDTFKANDFNLSYVLIGIVGGAYRCIAWQNSHAFNSSAATPHESRMGGILGSWRNFAALVMITLLSVCALTYFKAHSNEIEAALSPIKDPSVRDQMRSPLALTMMLPTGVKGMLLSICLMGIISGDGIHLHSWGSIFIQDVVMPLRGKPLSAERHILFLRLSIVFVALWAFLFGWLVPPIKYVSFWWGITESIFVSGAGIAIIGGLYWKRGTAAGAWTALIVGAVGSLLGLGTDCYYEQVLHRDFLISIAGHVLRLNIPWVIFDVMLLATFCYVVASILTGTTEHDMDRLLHRGQFGVEQAERAAAVAKPKRNWLYRVVTFGIDELFTPADRRITIGITIWSMLWFGIFAVGSLIYSLYHFSDDTWAEYWLWTGIYLPLLIGLMTTIWFTIGCLRDMRSFLVRLSEDVSNPSDDGSVGNPPVVQQVQPADQESAFLTGIIPGTSVTSAVVKLEH